jgi:hypothetical protein
LLCGRGVEADQTVGGGGYDWIMSSGDGEQPDDAQSGQDDPAASGAAGGGSGVPVAPVADALAQAWTALDGLGQARLWARSDAQARDLVVATAKLIAKAEAVHLAAVRDLDSRPGGGGRGQDR